MGGPAKINCVKKDCCTSDCLFKPEPGASVETERGTFLVKHIIRPHSLRLPYGNQPRRVEWYLAGVLGGKAVEITLVCAKMVRAKPRATHSKINEGPLCVEDD